MTRMIFMVMLSALLNLTGCATQPKDLVSRVKDGMDKATVLDTAGAPKRTYRTNSQDHWVYVYFSSGEELNQTITFEDGKVIRVAKPVAKRSLTQELEAMGTIQKSKPDSKGFKAIDGGPEDVNQP